MRDKNILFAGTPEFAAAGLQALLDGGYRVGAVYTQPDRPAGRGRKTQASAVKQLALAHELPVFQPERLKSRAAREQLAALRPDLLVVAAYGLILPPKVLAIPPLGCLNIHASLLPRWRGAAPIQRAIAAGDAETGITIMQMEAGLDTGPMLVKKICPILPADSAQTLHDRLATLGGEALLEALAHWDTLTPTPQDDALATYAHKLEKAEARLDWTQPAGVLARLVRAFNPWPVANAPVRDLDLRVWEAEAVDRDATQPPGTLIRADGQGLVVQTGDGALRLIRVQKPGGKPILATDFLNAHPDWRV